MTGATIPTSIPASTLQPSIPSPAPIQGSLFGVASGATAMACVGGSVAVSGLLATAPFYLAEGFRYAIACVLLLVLARVSGRPVLLPDKTEWLWLGSVALTGLVIFNIALVQGARHAEPAVLGVAVACVPTVLALIGPLIEGSRPRMRAVTAAFVVTAGAGLVQGLGRADAVGIGYAVVVFGCEAGFTLLAMPVLRRHGPWGVAVHTTWLASVVFTVLGLVREGPAAMAHLTAKEWLAIGYLALMVTAIAFVLWWTSVGRLGAARAGLLAGVAPVAAAITGILLGAPVPKPLVWIGIAVLALGLSLGLRDGARQGTGRAATADCARTPSRQAPTTA